MLKKVKKLILDLPPDLDPHQNEMVSSLTITTSFHCMILSSRFCVILQTNIYNVFCTGKIIDLTGGRSVKGGSSTHTVRKEIQISCQESIEINRHRTPDTQWHPKRCLLSNEESSW